jgi:hypothetical protein
MTRCILTLRVMETQRQLQSECKHPDRELLGWDHDLAFGRCGACGQVFLNQRGAIWTIRPAVRRADAGAVANDDDERALAANDDGAAAPKR